ncbi:MAG: DMT family transporter, partial [Actinobacteria bacterium]|nr:DMT family transporter [Actinomycetota bacterium]
FGAMTVAVRLGLLRTPEARLGAAATALVAFAVALAAVPFGSGETNPSDLAIFALAGLLAPGVSQLLFTLAVRDAGAARASVVVGAAPLVTVALGLLVLDEAFELALLAGAALIVVGGTALVWERLRPESFRAVGMVWAIGCTLLFASRDTFVRWFSGETPVASTAAAAATLFGGSLVLGLLARRAHWRRALPFVPAGICFGLSYVFLFEAYYRGLVTVVSPLVATESLWGVGLSALLIGRSELVGRRLVLGALLIVAGGALIGAAR